MSKRKSISGSEYYNFVKSFIEDWSRPIIGSAGPNGRTAIIEDSGKTIVTKDGHTIAKLNMPEREPEKSIADLLFASSSAQNALGDGTTSVIIITESMLRVALDASSNESIDMHHFFEGADHAINQIQEQLDKQTIQIRNNKEMIKNVALIASDGDDNISGFISEILSSSANGNAVITAQGSHGLENSYEIVEGVQLDNGYISQYFAKKSSGGVQYSELENPYILLYNGKISSMSFNSSFITMLESCARNGKSMFIIAEDVDGEALPTLVLNTVRGPLNICAIKSPGYGDRRKEILDDIAAITGAKVASPEFDSTSDLNEYLGSASTVKTYKDKTLIIGGNGNKNEINARKSLIEEELKKADSDYVKNNLKERLARFNGIARINVAGSSELEIKEKIDRVEDAIASSTLATRSGIVIGGGVSLLRASYEIKEPEGKSLSYYEGFNMVRNAAGSIFIRILKNKGMKDKEIYENMQEILSSSNKNIGYNVRSGKIVDMITSGIVNAAAVDKNLLPTAIAQTKLLCRSNYISYKEEEEKDNVNPSMNY